VTTYLLGGGRDTARCGALLAPFVEDARRRAGGRAPVVTLLLVLEADDDASVARFTGVLQAAGAAPAEVRAHVVVEGGVFAADVLDGVDAVFVGGGLTPAYQDAFRDIGPLLRTRASQGLPYAGFSAGAAIAAERALVGGHLLDGVEVASEDASEELDELEVRDGLGLVPFAVDVHAAQWGTLSRLVAAVAAGLVPRGSAVDEHTALVVDADGTATVHGSGQAWHVDPASGAAGGGGVVVRAVRP
jgi:cyanophycinase